MTCRDLITFLMDYLDDALGESERVRFDDHLRICPACRAYLQNYTQAIRLGRLSEMDDQAAIPTQVPEELVQAVLAARRGPTK
jgi:predicted anti-sigma-YlaC factor YlaD